MSRLTMVLAVMLALCVSAAANDVVQTSASPIGEPVPIIVNNGSAVGTIQLIYTVAADQFPVGDFASFKLTMLDTVVGANKNAPSYPIGLALKQTGSSNLSLTPDCAEFSVSGPGWTGETNVKISILPAVTTSEDGDDLVGNLQVETSPSGSKLSTITTVQVHIRLLKPTSCLRMYDFITAEDFSPVSLATVNSTKNNVSTNPGQFSDNILVVNSCNADQPLDLKILLDPDFQTNPRNDSGNAVFTYTTSGAINPNVFSISSFGRGTPKGQQLCLGSITVPAGQTLLAAVHTGINKDVTLTADGTFVFSAEAYLPGSACAGTPNTLVTPNPATADLPYTIKDTGPDK
jgi:hypothetical protein